MRKTKCIDISSQHSFQVERFRCTKKGSTNDNNEKKYMRLAQQTLANLKIKAYALSR